MRAENKFYSYPIALQWGLAILIFAFSGIVMGTWYYAALKNLLYFLLFPLIMPIFQFGFTPLFRLIGLYKYLSPMLLVYAPSQKKYDLHNGTSFDYLFVMKGIEPGRAFQNVMLCYYLEGLLQIIQELEAGDIPPEIEISGTSYFFSESTAKRLGFELVPINSFLKFNLYMNFIDLTWMYSLAKGRWTVPNFKEVKSVKTTGAELLKNKAYLLDLHAYLRLKNFKLTASN